MVASIRARSPSVSKKAAPFPLSASVPASDDLRSPLADRGEEGRSAPEEHHSHRSNELSSLAYGRAPVSESESSEEAGYPPDFASRRCDFLTLLLWYRLQHPLLSLIFLHPRDRLSTRQKFGLLAVAFLIQFDVLCVMIFVFTQLPADECRCVFAMVVSIIFGYPFFTATSPFWPFDDTVCSFLLPKIFSALVHPLFFVFFTRALVFTFVSAFEYLPW